MDTVRLPARMESLEQFRSFVLARLTRWGFPQTLAARADVVLEEVLVNIFRYAYTPGDGEVELRCCREGDGFCMSFHDTGRPFNPLDWPLPDLSDDIEKRTVGGLGIHLVRRLADDMRYRREGDANVLTICLNPSGNKT
jgi:serine/threonine-protein kinase RsbW